MTNQLSLTVYSTDWCVDCRRTEALLRRLCVSYNRIDIETDPDAAKEVERINKGYQSIPTLVFHDGSTLAEPTNQQLIDRLRKLGYLQESVR